MIALALLGIATSIAVRTQRAVDLSRAELQQLQRRAMPVRETVRSSPPLEPAKVTEINRIIHPLNVPWSQVFDALETATPQDVALVAVEPDAQRYAIRLLVEAKSTDALFVYLNALDEHPAFERVALAKHDTQEQDPLKPVRFSIDVPLVRSPVQSN
ncbi:MAG TPA: PilN domain-containing protein [Burkholderiaceae bacterium]|nr:PilN domain-containing protein [Burkholderiaceae bacterium]